MRVVLQRVSRAAVHVAGKDSERIGVGFVLLVGLEQGDGVAQLRWMADKIASLRVFPDEAGQMNLALDEVQGRCLVISQFTLLGDTRKGRRPSFVRAMEPGRAAELFEEFCRMIEERTGPIARGTFGAHMDVELVNDGPVTLILERPPPPE